MPPFRRFISIMCPRKHLLISKKFPPTFRFCVAWILAIVLPILTYYSMDTVIDDTNGRLYFSLLAGAFTLWLFKILPPYVPGIFMIVTSLSLNLLPSKIILSGLSSTPWVMVLCFYRGQRLCVSSGLLYRLVLLILKYIPPSQFWLNASVFFLGTLLTTVLPSAHKEQRFSPIFLPISTVTQGGPLAVKAPKINDDSL